MIVPLRRATKEPRALGLRFLGEMSRFAGEGRALIQLAVGPVTISAPKKARVATPPQPKQVIMSKVEDVSGESDFNSLTRWLMTNTKDKELTVLMAQLSLACKATSRACAKAGIANLFGMAGEVNSTGDDQKKLDVLSNDFFVNALVKSGSCCVLVSEENEEPIIVPEEHAGRFCVAFDPLDGSSNIDCNVSTGTIFAVCTRLAQREHTHTHAQPAADTHASCPCV